MSTTGLNITDKISTAYLIIIRLHQRSLFGPLVKLDHEKFNNKQVSLLPGCRYFDHDFCPEFIGHTSNESARILNKVFQFRFDAASSSSWAQWQDDEILFAWRWFSLNKENTLKALSFLNVCVSPGIHPLCIWHKGGVSPYTARLRLRRSRERCWQNARRRAASTPKEDSSHSWHTKETSRKRYRLYALLHPNLYFLGLYLWNHYLRMFFPLFIPKNIFLIHYLSKRVFDKVCLKICKTI